MRIVNMHIFHVSMLMTLTWQTLAGGFPGCVVKVSKMAKS